jgi:Fe-S oxidoreductase
MARHDGKWESARALLDAIPETELQDAAESKNRTYCCGAGGGCFWKEEVGGTRINEHRLDQLTQTNSETVAVGGPFCMTMLEDAVKARSLEETIRVRDLSELVAEAIDPDPVTNEAKTAMPGSQMLRLLP